MGSGVSGAAIDWAFDTQGIVSNQASVQAFLRSMCESSKSRHFLRARLRGAE
jgi:hypothetical protein